MFQTLNSGKRQQPLITTKSRPASATNLTQMSDEEARRRIKVGTKCLELQQLLQSQGRYTCEEITTKVETFRALLLRQSQPSAFPLLPFVYQTILQPNQIIFEKLKPPQLPSELIQRRGVLKHDVYTTRQRAEPEIVPYRHHGSRSGKRKRRKKSSHSHQKRKSRKSYDSSRSRSRSRESRKERKRKRSKSRKTEEDENQQQDKRYNIFSYKKV